MPRFNRSGTPIETFNTIQRIIRRYPASTDIPHLFIEIADKSLSALHNYQQKALLSKIANKRYFSFVSESGMSSRPVNADLFGDFSLVTRLISGIYANNLQQTMTFTEINIASYTTIISLACIVDLINPGDRQTLGTFYEYFIIYLLTSTLGTVPSERIRIPVASDSVVLTADLIFHIPALDRRFHVAVKNSTRERGSEFWVHQRILDKAFKAEKYEGIFFGLAETKLDHRQWEVVEICVPDQWRTYQEYIASISRIFYLDPPLPYIKLNEIPPYISVKSLGELFFDSLFFPKN